MSFRREGGRIIWSKNGETVWIESHGKDIIRVRASKSLRIEQNDWTLLPRDSDTCKIGLDANNAIIENGKISATITSTGKIQFFNDSKEVLLSELWDKERYMKAREFASLAGDSFKISQYFLSDSKEHFYGLGQDPHNQFDLKGSVIDLCHQNSKSTIPFLLSSKNYGFLWNNPAIGRVELANNRTKWCVESAKQIDYLVIGGRNIAEIVRRFTDISGKAPMLPEWATGLWQSKLRYETQEELLEVAREHKRRGIPLSLIVCDYFHWPQQGEWKFDKRYWPDPQAMVDELKEMGIRLMVSIWPTVDVRSENYEEMLENNYLVRSERGVSVLMMCRGPLTYYDTTNPDAGGYVFSKSKKNYYSYGIRNFWLDESEPEVEPYDYDNLRYYAGNGLEVSSLYPYYYAKNFYDGLKESGETEIVNLVRCAWIGSQRYGVVLWSGDIESTFESLKKQIKVGLHVSLCGITWWTTDIGGFQYGGKQDDPAFRELMIRWFQFGAFCPILRMHGYRFLEGKPMPKLYDIEAYCYSGGPNEIWSYGEEAYRIMKKYITIREQLKPYILEQMKKASEDGTPLMRPLFFDYNDKTLMQIDDQFMFGPDLLIAPVTKLNAKTRKVYLPKNTSWKCASSGKLIQGGSHIEVDAPLDTIPVFIKENSPLTGVFSQ